MQKNIYSDDVFTRDKTEPNLDEIRAELFDRCRMNRNGTFCVNFGVSFYAGMRRELGQDFERIVRELDQFLALERKSFQVNFVSKLFVNWAVVVTQLVERLLPTPEVHCSNPVTRKIYIECLLTTVLKRRI